MSNTKASTVKQPTTAPAMPATVKQPAAQAPSFLDALTSAAAVLVEQLPSQATGTAKTAPVITPAGSAEVLAALTACMDRYGEPLAPLTEADGFRHLYGGRKPEAPAGRKRQNAATLLAAVLHEHAAQGLPVDELYRAAMIAREAGIAGLKLKPGTGPEQIVAIACQQFNCGFYVEAGKIHRSSHKIGKPGSNKWLKVETA